MQILENPHPTSEQEEVQRLRGYKYNPVGDYRMKAVKDIVYALQKCKEKIIHYDMDNFFIYLTNI